MNRQRLSCIGHGDMNVWNPLGLAAMTQIIADLPLPPRSRMLDIGCGPGGWLVGLARTCLARGVGIESSPYAASLARRAVAAAGVGDRVEIREIPFDAAEFDDASVDIALCIGATHAIGTLARTLEVLHRLVAHGGLIIIGEGYWRTPPSPEYLAFLECTESDLRTHAGNVELIDRSGFDVVDEVEVSDADWAAYEDGYASNIEAFVETNPDDPDSAAFGAHIRAWREAYLKWGRTTLGFGMYIARRGWVMVRQ